MVEEQRGQQRADGRVVVVTGATGQQGGAVAAALRGDGWAVRAVVRDPGTPRARALASTGVQLVRGDLGDPASLRVALAGAHGVFSVQPSSGQSGSGVSDEDEVTWGVAVADAAQRSGVAHLVYSSACAAGRGPTGVGHLDSKSRVEEHLRQLPVATTVIRPATFMEILLLPGTGLRGGRTSFLVHPGQALQLIAVRDVGRIAARIFADPGRHVGRTVEIAGDEVTGDGLARALTERAGRPIGYERFPAEVLAPGTLLAALADLVDDGRLAGHADLDALRADFPFLLTVRAWLAGPGAPLLEQALRTDDGAVALR